MSTLSPPQMRVSPPHHDHQTPPGTSVHARFRSLKLLWQPRPQRRQHRLNKGVGEWVCFTHSPTRYVFFHNVYHMCTNKPTVTHYTCHLPQTRVNTGGVFAITTTSLCPRTCSISRAACCLPLHHLSALEIEHVRSISSAVCCLTPPPLSTLEIEYVCSIVCHHHHLPPPLKTSRRARFWVRRVVCHHHHHLHLRCGIYNIFNYDL